MAENSRQTLAGAGWQSTPRDFEPQLDQMYREAGKGEHARHFTGKGVNNLALARDLAPFFKSFLRIDADGGEVRIRCFAGTGCLEEEADPPVEDDIGHVAGTGWVDQTPGVTRRAL